MNSIYTRRSIRNYTDKKVEKEKIIQILRAAMQAPSAVNQQPWQFLVIENKEKLNEMSEMSPYSKMLTSASLAVVVLGDKSKLKAEMMWEQDLSAATQNLMLEAVNLNLGSVWLGVAPVEERMNFIKDLFNLSDNLMPFAVVSIGYPTKENVFVDRFDESRIHFEEMKE